MFNVSNEFLGVFLPILGIHILLIIISIVDLFKRYRRKTELLWIFPIVCITIFGPILYLTLSKNFRRDT